MYIIDKTDLQQDLVLLFLTVVFMFRLIYGIKILLRLYILFILYI